VTGIPEVVWDLYLRADKAPVQTLRACAAWLSAPAPVDAILTGASA